MEKRWGYQNAIDFAKKERDSIPNVPWVEFQQDAADTLDFADVIGATNKELEIYLSKYGGTKAILEQVVASHEMKLGAMQAQFDEEYNAAFARVMQEATGKKPTRDEARGLIMSSNENLIALFKQKVELETAYRYEEGRLNTFSQCYNTLSRIVSLRTDKNN